MNKELISKTFKDIQDSICQSISSMTSQEFVEDLWNYDKGTGGGRTRIISNGEIEKGGVNFSSLSGTMSDKISSKMAGEGSEFYATGVSLVLHPKNPFFPSIHMNIRYIERNKKKWIGGGIDLTPYYINKNEIKEDIILELAIEAGVVDCFSYEHFHEIHCLSLIHI